MALYHKHFLNDNNSGFEIVSIVFAFIIISELKIFQKSHFRLSGIYEITLYILKIFIELYTILRENAHMYSLKNNYKVKNS